MIKPIKIITGLDSSDINIYQDGKDINEEIKNAFKIDIHLEVDKLPEVIIHRYASKVEYEGERCGITFMNHKSKKVKETDSILEDTNYSNCKNGSRHYIKKEDKG